MLAFCVTLLVIVLFFTVILNIPLLLEVSYGMGGYAEKTAVVLHFSIINIRLYPARPDRKKKDKKKKKIKKNKTGKQKEKFKIADLPDKITAVKNGYDILRDDIKKFIAYLVKKRTSFRRIVFSADFGTGDACNTGILFGTVNAAVYGVLGFLHNTFTINNWEINIRPDFNSSHTDIFLLCILKTRPVHIIRMLFDLVKMYIKYNKSVKVRKEG